MEYKCLRFIIYKNKKCKIIDCLLFLLINGV